MATSSITKNFFIRDKQRVENFINLFDLVQPRVQPSNSEFVFDEKANEIFNIWENSYKQNDNVQA